MPFLVAFFEVVRITDDVAGLSNGPSSAWDMTTTGDAFDNREVRRGRGRADWLILVPFHLTPYVSLRLAECIARRDSRIECFYLENRALSNNPVSLTIAIPSRSIYQR